MPEPASSPQPTAALAAAIAADLDWARATLADLVACRSVADAAIEDPVECRRAAELVAHLVAEAGVPVEVIETPDGSLAVCGRAAPSTARVESSSEAPAVLFYTHHDVVPAGDLAAWGSDPWVLTERDGRWYGRGAADCKGNLVAILLALRALSQVRGGWPIPVVVVCEGSEEQSSGGMEALARARPELVAADAILLCDTGNIAMGRPTLTTSLRGTGSVLVTVTTMGGPVHSGMYGGPTPDALQALLTTLASLRGPDGATTIDGLDASAQWAGADYDVARFREDTALVEGVDPLIAGGSVGDLLWARPAATVLAIDAPPVAQVTAAIQGIARAVVNLRVPPTTDPAVAQRLLSEHLERHTPYGRVEIQPLSLGRGLQVATGGPAYEAMGRAMRAAFGVDVVTTGQGGSIPLAVALAELQPHAELLLLGVEEPASRIHGPDESVDPGELHRMALTLALFLLEFAV